MGQARVPAGSMGRFDLLPESLNARPRGSEARNGTVGLVLVLQIQQRTCVNEMGSFRRCVPERTGGNPPRFVGLARCTIRRTRGVLRVARDRERNGRDGFRFLRRAKDLRRRNGFVPSERSRGNGRRDGVSRGRVARRSGLEGNAAIGTG